MVRFAGRLAGGRGGGSLSCAIGLAVGLSLLWGTFGTWPSVAAQAGQDDGALQNPAGTPATQPAPAPTTQPRRIKLIPWLEVNRGTPQELERVRRAMPDWASVTDTICISTIPGRTDLYDHWRREYPDLHFLPGLKTHPRLTGCGFDNVAAWKLLARDVEAFCQATGERRILLENESALGPYVFRSECPIDLDRLREALQQLPKDVEYWWYPSVYGETPDAVDRSAAVSRVVEQVLDVRFTTGVIGSPRGLTYLPSKRVFARLQSIAERPPLTLVYFGTFEEGRVKYWPFDAAREILQHAPTDVVLFYPHGVNWEAVGHATAIALRDCVEVRTREAE